MNLSKIKDSQEQQYKEYLEKHISGYYKALDWLLEHKIISKKLFDKARADGHDESKKGPEEWLPYMKFFYGKQTDKVKTDKVKTDFDFAWLHHIHNNPHHWQYWVLIEDDSPKDNKLKALEIPEEYIIEMICDWWSFSWNSDNLMGMFDWYGKNKDKQVIHKESRKLLESYLDKIKSELSE